MLTDLECRNAKPRDKQYKLADGKGLFLLIHPNGSKYWRFKYRIAGKEKLLALGVYPEVRLDGYKHKETGKWIDGARHKCVCAREQICSGIDPSQQKKAQKLARLVAAGNSFEAVAKDWMSNRKHRWSLAHYTYTLRRFESYVFPDVGALPINDITAPLMLAMARKIESKGTIETTHKVMSACSQVFQYAIGEGKCERNPVADIRGNLKAKPEPKHMAALSEKDLPDLLRKIDQYGSEGGGELQTQYALQLLALTFVRTSELREATWDEFDLDKAEWRIPAERMKMKAPHVVPLSRQAVDVMKKLQGINGEYRYVFPGVRPSVAMSKNTVLFALYRMGYRGRMTGHGFRAVASTVLNETGFDADVIERQLAHVERNKVRAAYHRSEYLAERRTMMQQWADMLDNWRTQQKVVPIKSKAAA